MSPSPPPLEARLGAGDLPARRVKGLDRDRLPPLELAHAVGRSVGGALVTTGWSDPADFGQPLRSGDIDLEAAEADLLVGAERHVHLRLALGRLQVEDFRRCRQDVLDLRVAGDGGALEAADVHGAADEEAEGPPERVVAARTARLDRGVPA